MASDKKIAANRANAKKSTGPRTATGKARAALNGIPKGRLDGAMVIGSESCDTFHTLEAEYRATYRPQGPTQNFLLDQMVSASWRMYRLWHVERAAIDQEIDRQITPAAAGGVDFTELALPTRTSMALRTLSHELRPLDAWGRYEARLERHFRNCLDKLLDLQKAEEKARQEKEKEHEAKILDLA